MLSIDKGINFETDRITAVIRIVAGGSFFVGIGSLILITTLTESFPFIVIGMGLLLLIYSFNNVFYF